MNLFPYGKAALSMFGLAVVSAGWIFLHPAPEKKATLTYWTFSKDHYDAYQKLIPDFEAQHPGVHVDLEIVNNNALAARLQAAFLSDLDVPDMTELEIGTAGTMFRGPVKDIGFIDLKPRLMQSGLYERYVQSRFSPYTSRGGIYGLPQDVHPVQLVYNKEIFAKYGIDPDKIQTWDDFIAAGKKVTIPGKQYMIELSDSTTGSGGLETIMLQRGGSYFSPAGDCIIDSDIMVKSMEFYVPLVAGPNKIGGTTGDFYGATWSKSVEDGYIASMICPDWRTLFVQRGPTKMAGKMGIMPLPAAVPGGIRTSTWGGTMLGITKRCKDPDIAWQFAQFLYTDKARLAKNFQVTNILPPLKEAWSNPAFSAPNPYYGGAPLGAIYAKYAPSVPAQYTAPTIDTAKAKLGEALIDCVKQYNDNGDTGFDEFVRAKLKEKADDVRAFQKRNPY